MVANRESARNNRERKTGADAVGADSFTATCEDLQLLASPRGAPREVVSEGERGQS